jgi:formylglycine-generating enzyme required for sulfatase activity
VGKFSLGASPYGALDMAGNVWEWVANWYAKDYYRRSPYDNPTGPETGTFRVLRGGSWLSDQRFLRVSNRSWSYPDFSDGILGFRCLRSP